MVGWFGAAWVIAGTLIAPATVLDSAMYPRLSAASGNPAEFKRTFAMSFRPLFLLAVLTSAGTWLFAEVPVQLIYGLDKFGRASKSCAPSPRSVAVVHRHLLRDGGAGLRTFREAGEREDRLGYHRHVTGVLYWFRCGSRDLAMAVWG